MVEIDDKDISEKLAAFYKAKKAQEESTLALYEAILKGSMLRPCHFYPVNIDHDGLRWVCKYAGSDEAVGYGDSPSAAMTAFDKMWQGGKNDE